MTNVGKAVRFNRAVGGTNWSVIEATVLSKTLTGWRGRVLIEENPPGQPRREEHPWNAIQKGKKWEITGDGATLSNGDRVTSPMSFPFSLNPKVNETVRTLVSDLLDGKIVEASRVPTRLASSPIVMTSKPLTAVHTNGSNGNHNGTAEVPEVREILVSEIRAFEGQPRQEFTKDDLSEMRGSLVQEGQKQLIVVTPLTGVPGKLWELVDGERRYRGAVAAGKQSLLAIVKRYKDQGAQFWDSFTMNWGRRGHTPLESSRAVAKAIASGKTVGEIVVATGMSNCWVYQHMQLQHLDNGLQELLRLSVPKDERMRLGVAMRLSRVADRSEQIRIWEAAKKEKTAGLISLKVQELIADVSKDDTAKGRKRKPSDSAEKILRIMLTSETDLAFFKKAKDVDIRALIQHAQKNAGLKDLIKRMRAIADAWHDATDRVEKIAQ